MSKTMERESSPEQDLSLDRALPVKKVGKAALRGTGNVLTSKWGKRGVGALVFAGAAYAGATFLLEGEATSQAEERQQEETRLIDNMRTSGAQLDNSLVVLHEGVKYRSTPHQVAGKEKLGITLKQSNIEGEVPAGSVMIIERVGELEVEDNSGQKWGAFMLSEPESDDARLPEDIAKDYYWVNLSSLQQQNSDENTFIEAFKIPNQPEAYQGSDSITTVMEPNGILLVPGIDRSQAIGRLFNERDVDALLQMVNLEFVE